jgi:hypothetical protein
VSSRGNASVVVALGVVSLAAMVATSELLAESFDRPAAGRASSTPTGTRWLVFCV